MYETLKKINERPKPFEFYTARELWTNEHTVRQMLQYHLNDDIEASSRNSAFIEKSCNWIADHFNIEGKKVIDFGCGPGLYATRLAQKGAFVNTFKYEDEKVLQDKYTIFEANKSKRIVYNWLQHYSIDSLQAEFNQNKLLIKDRLANVAGGEFNPKYDEFAVIAGH